jgi:uncharacterized protein (DUF1800 family)
MRAAAVTVTALIVLFIVFVRSPRADAVAGAPAEGQRASVHLPWKEAGLTERQAAAHLLDRFAYGPRPGEVDKVIEMGLDRWFERQLAADLPDGRLEERLEELPALDMPAAEIARTYPAPGRVLAEARRAGVIAEEIDPQGMEKGERRKVRSKVLRFAREQGYRTQRELIGQLMTQKLWRAVGSENQLAEVMADFWFNHFNVSLTDNQSRAYLLSYERDAIRPHALGRMRGLLGATARHPAMLLYLDNAQSTAAPESSTTLDWEMEQMPRRRAAGGRHGGFGGRGNGDLGAARRRRSQGLNENYARELLELHTLGVDGGYTQKDVVEVARTFTGWTVLPPGAMRRDVERRLARVRRAGGVGGMGFRIEGEFLFRADAHDAGEKTILGQRFPAGRGIEDGEQVLDLLAAHPSTARHIAAKLAVRFVSDQPPKALVDYLAAVYLQSGGDVRRLLRAVAESPEFWAPATVGAKIKSPFELAASALRATGGRVADPRATLRWIAEMGQPLYAYQAPTGYPDRAESWVNTGSLLSRMNFGLQLASGRVAGVELDLAALNGGREPASREEALRIYAALLMPGRDLAPILAVLTPMANDPELARKVDQAALPALPEAEEAPGMDDAEARVFGERGARWRRGVEPAAVTRPPTPVEQVVGVILGSPEFQRR